MKNEKSFVTYEQFGALGDGVSDDFEALYSAHIYANENGLAVKGDVTKVYYIGKSSYGRTIPVLGDVDFGGATFIIDDSELPPHKNLASSLFLVSPSEECREVHVDKALLEGLSIKAGDKNIGVKFQSDSLITVYNDDRVFIRHGANKASSQKREMLIVDKDGNVDESTPVQWDYGNVTDIVVRPLTDNPVTLKNGTFVTVANRLWSFTDEEKTEGWREGSQYYYYNRGIEIRRSGTRVVSVTHIIKGEEEAGGYPYSGWLSANKCCNVTYEMCKLSGHKAYLTSFNNTYMGSYDTNLTDAVNITWKNCTQLNDITDTGLWGVMCSNFGRNLTLEGCVFSRFDAHEGSWNITVKDCTLGHSFNMVGGGLALIENTKKIGKCWQFIWLRSDYGSPWNGDIIIRNCEHVGNAGTECDHVNIIGGQWENWDFGYPCHMPTNIVIDNFKCDSERINVIAYNNINEGVFSASEENINPLIPTKSVKVLNQDKSVHFSKDDSPLYAIMRDGRMTVIGELL